MADPLEATFESETVDSGQIPDELSELLRAPLALTRINLTDPIVHHEQQVLSADEIVFNTNTKLVLGRPEYRFVVIVAKSIIFPGGSSKNIIEVPRFPKRQSGKRGEEGDPGRDGAFPLMSGGTGGTGKTGFTGPTGRNLPVLAIAADEIVFNIEPVHSFPIQIIAEGNFGGTGGIGGKGGIGGDGAIGISGENNL